MILVVDVANVMGSRPDGWWRDRAGAATRLMAGLVPLSGTEVAEPQGFSSMIEIERIVAVIEGKSRAAVDPDGLVVIRAPADGDSAIVAVAERLLAEGELPLVITADRGLRERLPPGSRVAGPGWLLGLL
jgi:hypothetical protein